MGRFKNSILISLSIALLAFFPGKKLLAGPGDTIVVQAFTFNSPQNAWFVFPPATKRYEKIIMEYTLKCVPGNNPSCGEWDYLTYNYLYDHTGVYDSNLYSQPSFVVNGTSPDSFAYLTTPSYTYWPHLETHLVIDSVLSYDSTFVGTANTNSPSPFNTAYPDGRTQYLWTAAELSSAGLTAGDISGMRFNVLTTGDPVHNLTLRFKHSTATSLGTSNYSLTGFTEVFSQNTTFTTGWNDLVFNTPFVWNGTDGIIVEIAFDNALNTPGVAHFISSETTAQPMGISSAGMENWLDWEGADMVNVPAAALAGIDSAVTVSLWIYGDPAVQPQADYAFEGLNAAGQRVINVHLPWSDNSVYWDCGNDGGSYDRINKAATFNDFAGKWNHWAFTKDVSTGVMRIYLNGTLWHSGTGLTRDMSGITQFRIGARGNGTGAQYDGFIDDFQIWNRALDATTIQNWMYKDLTPSHPYYSDLAVSYNFNEGSGPTTADGSSNGFDGGVFGPTWINADGRELFRNFAQTSIRPVIVLDQGTYVSHLETTVSTDSVAQTPIPLVIYGDSALAPMSTDTLWVWEPYNGGYVYDTLGNPVSSTFVGADTTIYKEEWPYFGVPFEVVDRYEIGRFITPYGIGLDLGSGFTWKYDVTDYRPLLSDSVHLAAGNWQELLDMKFLLIEGTPPRDAYKVENVWVGSPTYTNTIENFLNSRTLNVDADMEMLDLKWRQTGHGFGGNENCAEFCKKTLSLAINGFTGVYTKDVWRNTCGLNPVFPQGGTWIYDRANWCPGAEVTTYAFELSNFAQAGGQITIDPSMTSYTYQGGGSTPRYEIESQLVSYKGPNFSLDACIYDVISPSDQDLYVRRNPICKDPVIVIRNDGSTPLTSLDITYGQVGGTQQTFQWTGNLDFLKTEEVTLTNGVVWDGSTNAFEVTVSNPNGGADQYAHNNTYRTTYTNPPTQPGDLVLVFKTNSAVNETKYRLYNSAGTILYQSSPFWAPNTINRDTFHLNDDCYQLYIWDTGKDGLEFFANNDGTGYVDLWQDGGGLLHSFEANFGTELVYNFKVGTGVGISDPISSRQVRVYPNPTNSQLNIEVELDYRQSLDLEIMSMFGQVVCQKNLGEVKLSKTTVDMSDHAKGVYLVNLRTPRGISSHKVVVE
ncbi:MAG: T9SS type A sorting domain-containing protein [Bacteroidia bacterium]|nr:T9SS type A sorting domain-containing protein [Bacteroidia bacterium]